MKTFLKRFLSWKHFEHPENTVNGVYIFFPIRTYRYVLNNGRAIRRTEKKLKKKLKSLLLCFPYDEITTVIVLKHAGRKYCNTKIVGIKYDITKTPNPAEVEYYYNVIIVCCCNSSGSVARRTPISHTYHQSLLLGILIGPSGRLNYYC